jgi:hypothetical protein
MTPGKGNHGNPHTIPGTSKIAKVLFILKKRTMPFYNSMTGEYSTSSGLLNSASFVVAMLNEQPHIEAILEQVVDNNDIDRLVTQHQPTHVCIEALWVVPSKFSVLTQLHPTVQWIVRYHSEIPFLALEGVALEWTLEYLQHPNVTIAPNSGVLFTDLQRLALLVGGVDQIKYLPNYYPIDTLRLPHPKTDHTLDIGCFGAIRPLKNQLIQALAAVEFARLHNVPLRFHVNGSRVESGSTVLKNIRALFAGLPADYELVEHDWLDHTEFVDLVRSMDLGMQVSFTETFNIVTADFVANGVPVVASEAIRWLDPDSWADPDSVPSILEAMRRAFRGQTARRNRENLVLYNANTILTWRNYLL